MSVWTNSLLAKLKRQNMMRVIKFCKKPDTKNDKDPD